MCGEGKRENYSSDRSKNKCFEFFFLLYENLLSFIFLEKKKAHLAEFGE